MKISKYILLAGCMVLSIGQCFGQKKDSTWVGSVRGIVWDSEHNTVLRSATISIYTTADSSLIGYRLTNNYGEFDYKGLPCDQPLRLISTFIGYKSSVRNFIISPVKKDLDIGHVDLKFIVNELHEVVVSAIPPPVQMKGDTLEFNADAFKLNPNAQTEDLLRVLPGVTIWADGTITVNGREVKSVKVNGKPFFGSDARIATQNIPKNVVDKIQVYQKDKDPKKLTDSTTEINIKLKKGKGAGYFGKFSGGYGTGNHYESDGNLNFFNGRTQLGVALTSNDVNKVTNDINFILRNNTFKGNGANVEYQSDFEIEGINKFTAGGLIFQHDFIDNPDYFNNNRINGLYFLKHNQQDLLQKTETITTLNNSLFFRQNNENKIYNVQTSHNGSATYEKISNGNKFSVEGDVKSELTNLTSQYKSEVSDQTGSELSKNQISNDSKTSIKDLNLNSTFKGHTIDNGRSWLTDFELADKLNVTATRGDNIYKSIYAAAENPDREILLDRTYNNRSDLLSNNLTFGLPNFGALMFGDYKPGGIVTGFKNSLQVSTEKINSLIKDRDASADQYVENLYLTNNRRETILDTRPALTFTKGIYRALSNRYEKNFVAVANVGMQFYSLNSTSEKAFQQFQKSYQKFTPNGNISYTDRQYGEFTNTVTLQISTSSQYPTVQQLTPLVDSANLNLIQKGNPFLKEQDTREVTLNFNHISEKSTNIFSWSSTIRAGYVKNYFTNSSIIDSLGRAIYTTVNANGYRYLSGSAELKKAFKWADNQLQFSITPSASIYRTPNYTNGIFSFYNNFSLSYNPGIDYTYKTWLNLSIIEKQGFNHYTQNIENALDLSSRVNQTLCSASINCTPKLTIGSNATYVKSSYNGAEVKNFTIWNASVNYKFLKGNVAELKMSALDLLHQNTGLINYGSNNSITQGSANNLQQYFMLTLAYFPRKFSK